MAAYSKHLLSIRISKFVLALSAFIFFFAFGTPSYTSAAMQSQALDIHTGDLSHPVKLELRLIDTQTKLHGPALISEKAKEGISVIETTYTVRARAFGGDVYLPAYQEQIIFEPVFISPETPSNAVVPGTPSISLHKKLDKKGDRFILKEYEEVDMKITTSLKVLHAYMPRTLTIRTRLNTISWFPTVYQNGSFDAGTSPETGERLINIPLVQATYIPEQITRVDWESGSVILLKGGGNILINQQASIMKAIGALLRVGR